jgi:23S rRNA pseudouridine1911/1915/1917 synthase
MAGEERGAELFAVHRLDREVSGVMVYAKTPTAAAELSRQVADRSFKKEYLALVEGVPEEPSATLSDLLFKDSRKNKSFVVNRKRAGVKEAKLSYETVGDRDGKSLVKIELHTGRTHQIRVQFSSRKMPVLGDGKYGSSVREKEIALASYRIKFKHPRTKESMEFSQLPSGTIWGDIFSSYVG